MPPFFFAMQHFPDSNGFDEDTVVLFLSEDFIDEIASTPAFMGIGLCGAFINERWGRTSNFYPTYRYAATGTDEIADMTRILNILAEELDGPDSVSKYFTILTA